MPRAKIGPDRPEWEKVLKTLGPKDPGTEGPRDRRTPGPKDPGTEGPRDRRTPGPKDPGTEGPRDQPTVPTLPDDPGYHQQP